MKKLALLLIILSLLAGAWPALAQEDGGPFVTTTANLRVRATPTADSPILQTVPRNTAVLVYGRSADNGWLQVGFRGVVGWVSVFYVNIGFPVSSLPVVDGSVPSPDRRQEQVAAPDGTLVQTGQLVVFSTVSNVNIRLAPDEGALRLGQLPRNARATVTLLSPGRNWGLITYNGLSGWVALSVVNVLGDLRTVPVDGQPGSGATVPLPASPLLSLEQREAVTRAQNHYTRYAAQLSGLIDILNQVVNGGILTCGPAPEFLRPYRPFRRDLQLVPQIADLAAAMNAAFASANQARAQWLSRCGSERLLYEFDREPLRPALEAALACGALLAPVGQELAELAPAKHGEAAAPMKHTHALLGLLALLLLWPPVAQGKAARAARSRATTKPLRRPCWTSTRRPAL
ncbi:MAG: SH3 domain-containing protein [Anaerolineae bacterium]|nr:SH3 domain-containing protein [Anaerolineae bacterium]